MAPFTLNQDEVSRWHRTPNNPGWTHDNHFAAAGTWTTNDYDQERSMTYLRYAGENPAANASIKSWSATLSFQKTDDSEFQNRFPAKWAWTWVLYAWTLVSYA